MKSDIASTVPSLGPVLGPAAAPRMRLLDQVRARIRVKPYSIGTEEAYVDWIGRYIRFHGKRHPAGLSAAHVEEFLIRVGEDKALTAVARGQARSALLFLYRDVLGVAIGGVDKVEEKRTRQAVRPVGDAASPREDLPVATAQVVAAIERGLRHHGGRGGRRGGRG